MQPDFVGSRIRRLNVNLLVACAIGLLVIFAGIAGNIRYVYNVVFGPFDAAQADVLALEDAEATSRYFITIEGDDHADTGYTYVNVSDSGKETVEHYYHVLLLGDKYLLVKSNQAEIENEQTGALVDIPSDVQEEVIAGLEADIPEINGAFLPMMLDATNFRTGGYIVLTLVGIVALLLGIGVLLAFYRLANPEAHPALKALSKYGDLSSIKDGINREMAEPHEQIGKKIHFTKNWLVTTTKLNTMPYRDMIWGYKQVTQHRTNGIPTGKTYAAFVNDRHGTSLRIPGKEKIINQVLELVGRASPGIALGYSDELAKMWRNDRASLIAAVDQRRNSGE